MTRTMLNENNLQKYFWAEAINTWYVLNRVLLKPILKKTPYEILKNKKANIDYFKVFGWKCFILSTKDNLGNLMQNQMLEFSLVTYFQVKLLEFLTKKTMVVEGSIYVIFMNLIILFKKEPMLMMIYVMHQT